MANNPFADFDPEIADKILVLAQELCGNERAAAEHLAACLMGLARDLETASSICEEFDTEIKKVAAVRTAIVSSVVEQMVLAVNESAGYKYATADDITITRDSVDDFKRNPDLQFLELRETNFGDLHVFVKDSREVVVLDDGHEHRAVMFD